MTRFYYSRLEPDGKRRDYLCEAKNNNWLIVEAEVLARLNDQDPHYWLKTGDKISVREKECYFIKD